MEECESYTRRSANRDRIAEFHHSRSNYKHFGGLPSTPQQLVLIRVFQGKETYLGHFKNDAYNGAGSYKNDGIPTKKWAYEGAWFANRKHGYGLLSLGDNTFFQGLYKNDSPCGPGVLTDCRQKQSVGFWKGSSLVRLVVTVDSEIPQLSTTPEKTTIALKFRRLVSVGPCKDVTEIAQSNGLAENKATKLYSKFCKNPSTQFFNYREFDDDYFNDFKTLDNLMPDLSEQDFLGEGSKVGSEMTLTISSGMSSAEDEAWFRLRHRTNYLMAWNNTPIIIDLMTHSFRNRYYQGLAGFNVDDLLCCQRRKFRQAGEHEMVCRQFLQCSERGDIEEITRLAHFNNLNVNLTDNKGNGCLMRAAAFDHHPIIALMPVYSANVNLTNDEGFTPLNLAITRYLAMVLGGVDWGEVFLPPSKIPSEHIRKWVKCEAMVPTDNKQEVVKNKYLEELVGKKAKPVKKKVAVRELNVVTYLFDLKPQHVEIEYSFSSAIRSLKSLRPNLHQIVMMTAREETPLPESVPLQKVHKTIDLLLEIGADVNICPVPAPALILAFFTNNLELMRVLLTRGADPNSRLSTEDGELTCLHIIALAKPQPIFLQIIDLLLEFRADPNAQASITFDPESVMFLHSDHPLETFPPSGLTPLQALCFRADGHTVSNRELLLEILRKFIEVTTITPFLGHTILSLATVRLNADFVISLLQQPQIDPNECFNSIWGNLAACFLQYLGYSKNPLALIILVELEKAGMNPLRRVHQVLNKNAVNFALETVHAEESLAAEILALEQTTENKGSKQLVRSRRDIRKKLHFLQEIARNKVDRYIKGVVIRNLVTYIREIQTIGLPIWETETNYNVIQAKNWIYTDDFIEIATRNAKAGLLQLKNEELEAIFEIIYKEKETFPCLNDQKSLLKAEVKELRRLIWELLEERRKILRMPHRSQSRTSIRRRTTIIKSEKSGKESSSRLKKLVKSKPTAKRRSTKQFLKARTYPVVTPEEPDAEVVKQSKKTDFFEQLKDVVAMSVPYFQRLDRIGTSKVPKKTTTQKFNFDLYPEVDTQAKMYKVCYECLGRFSKLELCPACSLVWFCSTSCNIDNLTNRNSNHKCLTLFYGLGSNWHLLEFDEQGSLMLVPRLGVEESYYISDTETHEEEEIFHDEDDALQHIKSPCGRIKSKLMPCPGAQVYDEKDSGKEHRESISIVCRKTKKRKRRKPSFNIMKLYRQKGELPRDIRIRDYLLWGHLPFDRGTNKFQKQRYVLDAMATTGGSDFDVNATFPWMVYRDGQLYYRILPTRFLLENYSLI